MVSVIHPTKKETETLTTYYKKGPNTLVRARAQAILMSARGVSVPDIAIYTAYHAKTVRTWIHAWNTIRLGSIFPQYEENENASKLTRIQKEEIKDTLAVPDALGGEFWRLGAMKEHISTVFGVVYESERSYHYLLRHIGLSWKLPTPFDVRRDEKRITARMAEIREEIAPYLNNPSWDVLVADETRIDWVEETRRAWLPKGTKTIIKLERKTEGQSYFGALSLKTKRHTLIPLSWQDTDNIVDALTMLKAQYQKKYICLLWDNAAWHKSKALRKELEKGGVLTGYHLIHFPPYAPDENPEEHVWKYGKEKIANKHFSSFADLKEVFTSLVHNKTFDYKM